MKLPTDTDIKSSLLIWVEYICSEDTDAQKNPKDKVTFHKTRYFFPSFQY